jgi:hypothetical protein
MSSSKLFPPTKQDLTPIERRESGGEASGSGAAELSGEGKGSKSEL